MGRRKLNASDSELKKLYFDDGMRMREIADMYGCSVPAVCQRLQKMGVQARKSFDYPATDKLRAAWVENGKRSKGRVEAKNRKPDNPQG